MVGNKCLYNLMEGDVACDGSTEEWVFAWNGFVNVVCTTGSI